MALLQIHWQRKDGTSEFVMQRDIHTQEEMKKFVEDAKRDHPLPEGMQWVVHTEESEQFLKTIAEDSGEGKE